MIDAMVHETAGLAAGLEVFVAVARHEHVSRAAESLGMPQPTVSRVLTRLASDLGVALLERHGRGVRLTRQGRVLAGYAERALAEIAAGVDVVRAEVDATRGTVVLGFLHSMGPTAVPRMLRSFRDGHPDVTVRLLQDGADRVSDAVAAGDVDLGLVSPPPRHGRLSTRTLARQPLVAAVPTDHPLADRDAVSVLDLAADPLVTMRPGFGVRTLTDDLLRAAGVVPRYAFESDELTTVSGLVAAGLGVTVLPTGTAGPGTVEVPLLDKGAVRTIALVWARERALAPPVAALRRHLVTTGPAALR